MLITRHMKFRAEYLTHLLLDHLKWWRTVARFCDAPSFCSLSFIHYVGEYEYTMARKTSKSASKAMASESKQTTVTVWANMRLTADDEPLIVEDAHDISGLCARLVGVFLTGSDFSLRFNDTRGNFSAFIISPISEGNNQRTGISAYGPTIELTLAAILYKFDLFRSNPEKFTQGTQSLGLG
jgi:hypothetical protein